MDGERHQVTPQAFFQRATIAGKSEIEEVLKYECAIFPPALFQSPDVLLEPQKAQLADASWAYGHMYL